MFACSLVVVFCRPKPLLFCCQCYTKQSLNLSLGCCLFFLFFFFVFCATIFWMQSHPRHFYCKKKKDQCTPNTLQLLSVNAPFAMEHTIVVFQAGTYLRSVSGVIGWRVFYVLMHISCVDWLKIRLLVVWCGAVFWWEEDRSCWCPEGALLIVACFKWVHPVLMHCWMLI